jgi:hypothetical protein
MAALVPSRFNLKTLHEEIGLYDRKIAHTMKYETFATDEARNTAAAKLTAKRALLVRSAQQMASDGIEFLPSELPLSLRAVEAEAPVEAEPALSN